MEVQDWSATCDRSLMFHFNVWKNKRTMTQRTKSKRQPDLTTTHSHSDKLSPNSGIHSLLEKGCQKWLLFLPSDHLRDLQWGGMGLWGAAGGPLQQGAVSLMQNRTLCMRRRAQVYLLGKKCLRDFCNTQVL